MQSPETTHDYRPTHNPTAADVIEAALDAAQAWQAVEEWVENRPTGSLLPDLTGYLDYHEELNRRQSQAVAAQAWLEDLRALHLACTCDPDPRRESAVCPACVAVMEREEMPF